MIAADAPTTGRHARPYDHDAEVWHVARRGMSAWGKHRRGASIWARPGVSSRWVLVRKLGSSGSES